MKILSIVAACLALLPVADAVRADVFELKDGGQVVGTVLQKSESGDYTVRTADGAEVTLARDLLQRVVEENDAEAEYREKSRRTPDTPEAHRELAAWCREHKLTDEAKVHLARVVELDPSDDDARRSLGYQRVGNRWLTDDELMIDRGMKFYDGKYRTPQDIAIRERDKREESVSIDWFSKIRMWRGWLDNRRAERIDEGAANIAAINDPQAAPALIRVMANERDQEVFEQLLAVLGRLDHPAAVQTLVAYTLDPEIDGETRDKCLDYLLNGPRPVSILPYVQALKHKDNVVVNRAGYALGKIGDKEAISPLIDALVTTHKYQQGPASGGGTAINAGFDPSGRGGGGLSLGGNAPQIVTVHEENERVLQALIQLAGPQKLEYDEQAWRAWFVDLQMRQRFHSRRDE
jgi:hypothetical protein